MSSVKSFTLNQSFHRLSLIGSLGDGEFQSPQLVINLTIYAGASGPTCTPLLVHMRTDPFSYVCTGPLEASPQSSSSSSSYTHIMANSSPNTLEEFDFVLALPYRARWCRVPALLVVEQGFWC